VITIAQAERRRDPYPFTWEIPVGILATWLLLAGLATHTGRAIANWTAGAGWTWPAGRALFASLPDLLTGDPTAGLTLHHPPASPAAVYGWIITVQILLAATIISTTVWALRRWGPGRMKGMASPEDAEQILGISRLRKVAPILRPDLHPPTTTTRAGGHDGYHPTP
jgi:hypothetical protein